MNFLILKNLSVFCSEPIFHVLQLTGQKTTKQPPVVKYTQKEAALDVDYLAEEAIEQGRTAEEVKRSSIYSLTNKPILDYTDKVDNQLQQKLVPWTAKKVKTPAKLPSVSRFTNPSDEDYERMKADKDEERFTGVSTTPGAWGTGDVWGRSTISDVIRMVERQSQRRKKLDAVLSLRKSGLTLMEGTHASTISNDFSVVDAADSQSVASLTVREDLSPGRQKQKQMQKMYEMRNSKHNAITAKIMKSVPRLLGVKKLKFVKMDTLSAIALERMNGGGGGGRGDDGGSVAGDGNNLNQSGHGGTDSSSMRGLNKIKNDLELPMREITCLSTRTNMKYMLVGNDGLAALCRVLRDDTIITRLCFAASRLLSSGATILAETMPTMTKLVEVDLSQNGICDEGAAALADMLRELSVATELDTHTITAEPIWIKHPIRKLSIAANRISAAGANRLLDAVLSPESELQILR